MNAKLAEHIIELNNNLDARATNLVAETKTTVKGIMLLQRITEPLSDTYELNGYGGVFWVTVKNRDDLRVFMSLAPQWSKENDTTGINYKAIIDGVQFRIRAEDDALPGTCKLVEEEVVIPAQPERIEKRKVVRCNQPVEATTPASEPTETPVANENPV